MTNPSDIVEYLAGIKNARITRILPCYVTIGRQTYPAARYWETLATPENSQAWQRGEREYTREMIYCAGYLPSVKLRGNVAFTVLGEPYEWYVAGYYGDVRNRKQTKAEPSEFHPFGNSFLLSPWDQADGIDKYARVPYRRVTMSIGL